MITVKDLAGIPTPEINTTVPRQAITYLGEIGNTIEVLINQAGVNIRLKRYNAYGMDWRVVDKEGVEYDMVLVPVKRG